MEQCTQYKYSHDVYSYQKLIPLITQNLRVSVSNCLHPCQSKRVCAHMLLYLHVYVLLPINVRFKKCRWCVLSCVTQSRSSLSSLPGPVVVFRAPPEGPLAQWERCWRRPGPAVLLPSPSAGCQTQRVPLSCQDWRCGCLHS